MKIKSKEFFCKHCNSTFSRLFNLNRHLVSCERKLTSNDNIIVESINDKKLISTLSIEIKTMSNEIESLKSIIMNFTELQRKNNEEIKNLLKITNNTVDQNNTNIIAHGSEDFSFLTRDNLLAIMQRGMSCVSYFVKFVYFNDDKPEYKNIYLRSLNCKNVNVYTTKWEKKSTDETISILYLKCYNYFRYVYESNHVDICNQLKANSKKFYDNLNENIGSDVGKKNCMTIIKQTLYDNRPK